MTVNVTQKHIDDGIPKKCKNCPVALALTEALQRTIEVTRCAFWIGTEKYDFPAEVRTFIGRFDEYKAVRPFSFEIPDSCRI